MAEPTAAPAAAGREQESREVIRQQSGEESEEGKGQGRMLHAETCQLQVQVFAMQSGGALACDCMQVNFPENLKYYHDRTVYSAVAL